MITIPDAATLQAQILAFFTAYFTGRDTGTYSYLGQWSRTLAESLLGVYQAVRDAETGAIPSDSTASDRLTEWAVLLGLSDGSGTAGKYGRLAATIATGGAGSLTYSGAGPFPYTLASGQTMYAPDGVTLLQTTANVVWGSAGAQTASINAVTAGTAGNLSTGTVLSLVSPPASVASSITLSTATTGGTDTESDAAVLARILDRLQNPPKGGTAADWRAWAEGVSGVNAAYVYPRRNGTGTVMVVATQAGTGVGRKVGSTIVTAILAEFDAVRPVTVEGRSAQAPYMPSGAGTAIEIRPAPTTGNGFDLSEAGGPYTVASATASTVTFNNDWIDITTKVNAGGTPRIAITSITSAWVLPQHVPILSYNAGTKTATLASGYTLSPVPLAGDLVYSGGNCVEPVSQAALDLVDALGPSRASGYADPDQAWEDVLRVDQLIRATLDAVDDNGNVVANDLQTDPTIDGVAVNKEAADNTADGPQMLYASTITVRQ